MEPAMLRSSARLAGRAVLRTQSDKRLVELVREGSEPAFEVIVERYRGQLRRYCRRLAPGTSADDAVQHTFLNAYLELTAGSRVMELRPWLFRVTHNAALDALRRDARSFERLDETYEGAERPEAALERKTNLKALVSNLDDLPERQRSALVLREMEGRSREEIARELGVTGGAVRQLLNRARTGLRAAASAILPPWLLVPLARTGRDPGAERIAEVAAGAGTAVGLTKVAAIFTTTAVGLATVSGGGVALDPRPSKPADSNRAASRAVAPASAPGAAGPSRESTRLLLPKGETGSKARATAKRRAARRSSRRDAARRKAAPQVGVRGETASTPSSDDDDDGVAVPSPGVSSDDGDDDGVAVASPSPDIDDDDDGAPGSPGAGAAVTQSPGSNDDDGAAAPPGAESDDDDGGDG